MHSEIKQKYETLAAKIKDAERPVVLVNACTHGHEKVGLKINESLTTLTLKKGTLITNTANERACAKNTAYVESDLNRVFPGKPDGTYEEQLAYYIHSLVQQVDVVIDIHSTETTTIGEESALIVTKLDTPTKEILETVAPPKVLLMQATQNNAVISGARIGIGIEYGKDKDENTYACALRDIKKILANLGMLEAGTTEDEAEWSHQTEYYSVHDTLPKEDGFSLSDEIKNFQPIAPGETIGYKDGNAVVTENGFIPILFGNNRYKHIYGFMGTKMDS